MKNAPKAELIDHFVSSLRSFAAASTIVERWLLSLALHSFNLQAPSFPACSSHSRSLHNSERLLHPSNMLRRFSFLSARSSDCLKISSPVASLASSCNLAPSASVKSWNVRCSYAGTICASAVLQTRFWHTSACTRASSDSLRSSPSEDAKEGGNNPAMRSAIYRGSTSSGIAWEYEGEVDEKGRKNGLGKCSWDNGDFYEGQWKSDEKHGKGIYKWPGGKVYDGEWKDDKAEGLGKMTYPDAAVYEGAWEQGFRRGHGVATWPSGMRYEGEWREGKRNGQGKLTAPDGSIFSGEWSDGVPHGSGSMSYPSGRVDHGVWKLGKKIE